MKKIVGILLMSIIVLNAQTYDKYIWETHRAEGISGIDNYAAALRTEVDSILARPNLRALRAFHTDIADRSYYIYTEPGRIITTLALAFPYLSTAQQAQVKSYVRAECADAAYTPWSSSAFVPIDRGSLRNQSLITSMHAWSFFWGMDGQKRPTLQSLYGLWAYAYNSGDTALVRDNWTVIKSYYSNNSSDGNIYGTFSGHIAMARLAHLMNDNTTMNTAVTNARTVFADGINFSTIASRTDTYYDLVGYDYGGGSGRNIIHDAFFFLNCTPEVGRYLQEANTALRDSALARNNRGKSRFPFWFVRRAPYFTVWGGEEGVGLVPEIIGMIFPIERWVAGASKETLRGYQMHRAAYGIGDCYAIEAMINTINAYGTESWADVRTTGPVHLSDPVGKIAGKLIEKVTAIPSGKGVLMTVQAQGVKRLSCMIFGLSGKIVFKGSFDNAGSGIYKKEIRLPAGSYVWNVKIGSGTSSNEKQGEFIVAR